MYAKELKYLNVRELLILDEVTDNFLDVILDIHSWTISSSNNNCVGSIILKCK